MEVEGDEDDPDKLEEQEALQRAVAENPALALEHPELAQVIRKGAAAEEKEKGNRAFSEKRCTVVCLRLWATRLLLDH